MKTKDLIKALRNKAVILKENKPYDFSKPLYIELLHEAAGRLEELEGECASLANTVVKASDTLRSRNDKLKDMRKIAEFYHRELEKKCNESAKPHPLFLFTKRAKLSSAYQKWIKENKAADCPFNVISFLSIHHLIDEEKAMEFLKEGESNEP